MASPSPRRLRSAPRRRGRSARRHAPRARPAARPRRTSCRTTASSSRRPVSTTSPSPCCSASGHEVAERLLQAQAVGAQRETPRAPAPAASGRRRRPARRSAPRPRRAARRRRRPPARAAAPRGRPARATSRSSESRREPRAPPPGRSPAPGAAAPASRSRSSASSSSAVRIASGVRSSWLASATSARSRSTARCRRPSIAFSVPASRDSSSSPAGTGSAADVSSPEISSARRRSRSTGAAAPAAMAHPSGQAGERERARQADRQVAAHAGERVVDVVERLAHDERDARALHLDGARRRRGPSARSSSSSTSSTVSASSSAGVLGVEVVGRRQRGARVRRASTRPPARDDLRRRVLVVAEQRRQHGGRRRRARQLACELGRAAPPGRRRPIGELAPEPQHHKTPGDDEHHRHRDGERRGHARADREPAQLAVLRQPVALAAHRPAASLARRGGRSSRAGSGRRRRPRSIGCRTRRSSACSSSSRRASTSPGLAHEQLEDGELLRGQVELVVAAPHAAGGGVEPQVADAQHHGYARLGAAAQERAQPREQLPEGERLDQVVVRRARGRRPRSSTASRAVSMRTGDQTPRSRSVRHTVIPSMPGSMRSRTIASYATDPARHSASSPSCTASAANPASVRPRCRSAAIFGSSSTMSTRTVPGLPAGPQSSSSGASTRSRTVRVLQRSPSHARDPDADPRPAVAVGLRGRHRRGPVLRAVVVVDVHDAGAERAPVVVEADAVRCARGLGLRAAACRCA